MTHYQQFLAWIAEGKLDRIRFCAEGNSMKHSFLAKDMESHRFAAAVKNDDPTEFDWAHMTMALDKELINVNGIMVPAPEKGAPKRNASFYTPSPEMDCLNRGYVWDGGEFDRRALARGLVHLSVSNAQMHAKAMLGNTTIE